MFKKLLAPIAIAALMISPANATAVTTNVDVELQLLIDVSGSVNRNEYALQMKGYQNAFLDSSIRNAILDTSGGKLGSIAIQFVQWSSSRQQSASTWYHLDTDTAITNFANLIGTVRRAFWGGTSISSAIRFGTKQFNNNFNGTKNIMDVSGDGLGYKYRTQYARKYALKNGIDRINGITIGGARGLQSFYKNNVIGGTDSFHMHAASFSDFNDAVKKKIYLEVGGGGSGDVAEPATLGLLGLSLLGFALIRRRA